ncbi:MAG TPA: efflux RND transporter periplasmic adaptor subunit [Gemmatimonadaceae bacterium]|nr:efflux RND transporter periplasmic adaptor subunit [Gemmatimonadaceae bacterium]
MNVRARGFRLTAMVAAVLLPGCSRDSGEDAAVQAVVNVRTAVVTKQAFTETIGALGVVSARPGHMASLTSPGAARIARVMVAPGQHVAAGTTLVELDQTSFVATSRTAAAALAAAQRAYDRTKRLVDEGITPAKDLEAAEAELERAKGDASNARRQQELSTIASPIGGVVTRVNAVVGATIDPATVLVEVADPSALDLLFTVTPTQAGQVRTGEKVQVSAGQNAAGEPLGVATIVDVGGIVDTASRGVTIRAQAPTTRRPLRIGETVFGVIQSLARVDAIVIPVEALVPDGEGFKVFVVNASNMAHAREVEVGGRTDRLAEITQGLAAGERIVTYGAYGIEDSAKVAPTPVIPAQRP